MGSEELQVELIKAVERRFNAFESNIRNDFLRVEAKVDDLANWRRSIMGWATGVAATVGFIASWMQGRM